MEGGAQTGCFTMAGDSRQFARERTKIPAVITAGGRSYDCYVVDLSEGGLQVLTGRVSEIWVGQSVEVLSAEFGLVHGRARWRKPGRLGIEIEAMFNTRAHRAAFRNLHSAGAR